MRNQRLKTPQASSPVSRSTFFNQSDMSISRYMVMRHRLLGGRCPSRADYVTGSLFRNRRPPPEGVDVDYPRYPGAALATDYLSWCCSGDGEDSARRPSPQGTVALNSRAHFGRTAPRWRRRSAVLCQNHRLASPCRAAEGTRYQQHADGLNPPHDGFHVHR